MWNLNGICFRAGWDAELGLGGLIAWMVVAGRAECFDAT